MLDEKLLVFVLGAPGAGKGTQCDLIVKEYGWSHISAGDLLRAQVQAGTEVGKQASEYLKAGTMVPASMIIGLLREALSDARHTKVLIDGFPRVLDQLKEFEQQVRPCDRALFYNVPEEAARSRLLKRGETSGRVDDNEETIRTRFVVFKTESMPVITELEAEGKVAEFDAAQPPEQVFAATRQVIEQLQQQLDGKAVTAAAAPPAAAAGDNVSSPKAATAPSPAAVSPVPASPVAAAAAASAAAVSPVPAAAVGSTPASPRPDLIIEAPSSPVAAAAAGAAAVAGTAALAAAAAAGSTTASPVKAATAGEEAPAASAAASALSSATSLPRPSLDIDHADAVLAAAVASPRDSMDGGPGIMSPMAAAAAAAAATAASTAGTLASLQVDLSGIRTPIVICGPSGVGKGTLIGKLMEAYGDRFGFSVSHTTRAPRPGECHGKHYYFTERDAMAAQVAAGMFLEHAVVHGNMYGTSLAAVAQVSATGKHCVLDIDVQGAAQVRKSALGAQCLFIFIAPPSQTELERRLRNRGTETEDKVLQRLANAESEIAKAQEPGLFHHVLVNAELEPAYQELCKLIAHKVPGLLPVPAAAAEASSPVQPAAAPAAAAADALGGGQAASSTTAAADGAAVSAATSNPGTPSAAVAASSPSAAAAAVSSPSAAAAGLGAAAGIVAAVGGVAAMTAALAQQPQQPLQAQPLLANGSTPSAAAGVGGTAALLDFGFGASGGPAVAAKGMPVRQYMDTTVIPVLREGLKALNAARPDDPLQFLADYLVTHKAAAA